MCKTQFFQFWISNYFQKQFQNSKWIDFCAASSCYYLPLAAATILIYLLWLLLLLLLLPLLRIIIQFILCRELNAASCSSFLITYTFIHTSWLLSITQTLNTFLTEDVSTRGCKKLLLLFWIQQVIGKKVISLNILFLFLRINCGL